LDAAVVGAASDQLKRLAGWPAYAAASVRQLPGTAVHFTIRLDDGVPFERLARSVAVGNTGQLPGGFPILPDARPDDGLLDVCVLAPRGLVGWMSVGLRAVTGSRRDDLQLERFQAQRVEIKAAVQLPRQVDGEVVPASDTLSVSVLPGALVVKVPRLDQKRRAVARW
jgi:diacylglycerol kinase family enzyme